MKVRTIKDVDDETWLTLKEIAEKRKMKMGKVLGTMIKDYSKKKSLKLSDIIPKKPILTDEEAEDMIKLVRKMRKESGYRNVKSL